MGAIAAAIFKPDEKAGKAAGIRINKSCRKADVFMVLLKSRYPWGVLFRPSKKDEVTGKKIIITVITIFELIPKPNHNTSKGARAKVGIDWLIMMMGINQWRRKGTSIIKRARNIPKSYSFAGVPAIIWICSPNRQASKGSCVIRITVLPFNNFAV